MLMVYVRMLLALVLVIATYAAIIFFIPITWEKIDAFLWVKWNEKLIEAIELMTWKAQNVQDVLENKLDNPAPNTTRNIEGRTRGE